VLAIIRALATLVYEFQLMLHTCVLARDNSLRPRDPDS